MQGPSWCFRDRQTSPLRGDSTRRMLSAQIPALKTAGQTRKIPDARIWMLARIATKLEGEHVRYHINIAMPEQELALFADVSSDFISHARVSKAFAHEVTHLKVPLLRRLLRSRLCLVMLPSTCTRSHCRAQTRRPLTSHRPSLPHNGRTHNAMGTIKFYFGAYEAFDCATEATVSRPMHAIVARGPSVC